jgi:hypothetical protein
MAIILSKLESVQMLSQTIYVSTKAIFYMNIVKYFTFTKIKFFDVYAKFALEWQPLIEANTLT